MRIIVRPTFRRKTFQVLHSPQMMGLCVALMTPASLLAFVLAAWRLGSDLGFTGEFAIGQGFFSHWIVWAAIGIGIQSFANTLNRGFTATGR
jgi:hypothetical protein